MSRYALAVLSLCSLANPARAAPPPLPPHLSFFTADPAGATVVRVDCDATVPDRLLCNVEQRSIAVRDLFCTVSAGASSVELRPQRPGLWRHTRSTDSDKIRGCPSSQAVTDLEWDEKASRWTWTESVTLEGPPDERCKAAPSRRTLPALPGMPPLVKLDCKAFFLY